MQFLILAAAVSASLTNAACANPKEAVEWRLFSTAQKDSYLNAVNCLRGAKPFLKNVNTKNTNAPTSAWEDLVYIHYNQALIDDKSIHNTAQFLPWHRLFLVLHDTLLETQCNYTGPYPFWDWTIDSQAPEKAPVWTDLGGNGKVQMRLGSPLVTNISGYNRKTKVTVDRSWAKSQGKNDPALMGANYSPAVLQKALKKKSFNSFRTELEGTSHNQVHNGIGGQMSTLASPNDPIFFFHHRNIDRFWAIWQDNNANGEGFNYAGNVDQNYPDAKDAKFTDVLNFMGLSEAVLGINTTITVDSVMKVQSGAYGKLCYNYQNSVTPVATSTFSKRRLRDKTTPSAFDRQNKFNIRIPTELPEQMLKMMKYPDETIAAIRQTEADNAKFITFANTKEVNFPSAIKNVEDGHNYGWRSMTDDEVLQQQAKFDKLIAEFESQQ